MRITRRTFVGAAGTGQRLLAAPAPEACDFQNVRRIAVVGDIHGDCDALVAVLRMAGLVSKDLVWAGGDTHLVQMGDLVARGVQTRKVFDLLMQLEKDAPKTGGQVHVLIGNHDAGLFFGDLRSVMDKEYADFRSPESTNLLEEELATELEKLKVQGRAPQTSAELEEYKKAWLARHPPGYVEFRRAFSASGEYGRWILKNNTAIRVNDTLFVHGGISPKYLGWSLARINETIRQELSTRTEYLPGFATDSQGPLLYRGLSQEDEKTPLSHVEAVLRTFKVRRIVVAHNVTLSTIMPRYGARVIDVDVGLSRFYGRPPACLVIEGPKAYVLFRGARIPLPGPSRDELLAYLRAVEKLDTKPSPVTQIIERVMRGVNGGSSGSK